MASQFHVVVPAFLLNFYSPHAFFGCPFHAPSGGVVDRTYGNYNNPYSKMIASRRRVLLALQKKNYDEIARPLEPYVVVYMLFGIPVRQLPLLSSPLSLSLSVCISPSLSLSLYVSLI